MDNPIESIEEANRIMEYLVDKTSKTMSVSKAEAKKRIEGLLKSGILEMGNAEDPSTQYMITAFLSIPSSQYAHLK